MFQFLIVGYSTFHALFCTDLKAQQVSRVNQEQKHLTLQRCKLELTVPGRGYEN